MNNKQKAQNIILDIRANHLPRVIEGLEKGYIDENQILVIYDHALRARILNEFPDEQITGMKAQLSRIIAGGVRDKTVLRQLNGLLEIAPE